jgi:hypothetical protein
VTLPYADLLGTIKARSVVSESGCWVFSGSDNGHGYQSISGDYAHRHMHRLCIGPIPEGYEVDHLCFRPACVNPAHLEAVTPEENQRRAFAAKVECKYGHPLPRFEGKNRPCAPCHAMREAKRKQRIRDGLRPPVQAQAEQHGTATGYDYGCRCAECREAIRLKGIARRRSAGVPTTHGPPPGPIKHGTLHAYNSRRCRCDACRAANTENGRLVRARRAARAAA